jgi:hypothetical protein
MYLLRYWFKKQFPFKDYENADVDPDPGIVKRKATLKGANKALREQLMQEILTGLETLGQDGHCQDINSGSS